MTRIKEMTFKVTEVNTLSREAAINVVRILSRIDKRLKKEKARKEA